MDSCHSMSLGLFGMYLLGLPFSIYKRYTIRREKPIGASMYVEMCVDTCTMPFCLLFVCLFGVGELKFEEESPNFPYM